MYIQMYLTNFIQKKRIPNYIFISILNGKKPPDNHTVLHSYDISVTVKE